MVKLGKISEKTKKTYELHHVVHNGMMKVEVKKKQVVFLEEGQTHKVTKVKRTRRNCVEESAIILDHPLIVIATVDRDARIGRLRRAVSVTASTGTG